VQTTREPSRYTFPVSGRSANLDLSGLFAYKLDWQTVFYLGYGDQSTYASTTGEMERSGRQLFAKVSYAWQR